MNEREVCALTPDLLRLVLCDMRCLRITAAQNLEHLGSGLLRINLESYQTRITQEIIRENVFGGVCGHQPVTSQPE